MKKFWFFAGCKIPYYLPHYAQASRAVLQALGVKLLEGELNCCGYPARELNPTAAYFSAARILALASRAGGAILTPCQCCFGQLQHTIAALHRDPVLVEHVNELLAQEHLQWHEDTKVYHLLQVLWHDIGVARLQEYIVRPYQALFIACHYGCHALRPSKVTAFDNPLQPTMLEQLVSLTGAQPVDWSQRLQCCGQPLAQRNPSLARYLTAAKLANAARQGAHYLCTACTYCQMQFEQVRDTGAASLAAILYPQLLGLSMGLPASALGLTSEQESKLYPPA